MTGLITQAELKRLLEYDPLTGVFTWRHRDDIPNLRDRNAWNTRYAGKRAGSIKPAAPSGPYRVIRIHGRAYYEHRLAWLYMKGEFPDGLLDHRNGDGLANRFDNLRASTYKQNSWNSKRRRRGSSGFKGVTWKEERGKWVAQIFVDGRNRHLGYFDDPEAAHDAYIVAARDAFGRFARSA